MASAFRSLFSGPSLEDAKAWQLQERLEMVPEFYEKVGQHLRVWVPPPPKLETEPRADTEDDTGKSKTVHAPETDSAKPSSLPLVDDSDEA